MSPLLALESWLPCRDLAALGLPIDAGGRPAGTLSISIMQTGNAASLHARHCLNSCSPAYHLTDCELCSLLSQHSRGSHEQTTSVVTKELQLKQGAALQVHCNHPSVGCVQEHCRNLPENCTIVAAAFVYVVNNREGCVCCCRPGGVCRQMTISRLATQRKRFVTANILQWHLSSQS